MTKKVKCAICGKQFEMDRMGGNCPKCRKNMTWEKFLFKPDKDLDKELKKEKKRGVAKNLITPGTTFSNIPAVNIGVKIVFIIIFFIIMNMFFL
jgi:uncharacterized membrane protein YvbJ